MIAILEHKTDAYALELAAWAVPALLAWFAVARSRPGGRLVWACVAVFVSLAICDKAFDLHSHVRAVLQFVASWFDPRDHLSGDKVIYRIIALAGGFFTATACLWWIVRKDRQSRPAKWVALAGVVVLVGYLASRLVPGIGKRLESTGLDWLIEAAAWVAISVGCAFGLRRESEPADD